MGLENFLFCFFFRWIFILAIYFYFLQHLSFFYCWDLLSITMRNVVILSILNKQALVISWTLANSPSRIYIRSLFLKTHNKDQSHQLLFLFDVISSFISTVSNLQLLKLLRFITNNSLVETGLRLWLLDLNYYY